MRIDMPISMKVTQANGRPVNAAELDQKIDALLSTLSRANKSDAIQDIDADAALARGEVTVHMWVEALNHTEAFVRALTLIIPAIIEIGDIPNFGQTLEDWSLPTRPRTEAAEVWEPRPLDCVNA